MSASDATERSALLRRRRPQAATLRNSSLQADHEQQSDSDSPNLPDPREVLNPCCARLFMISVWASIVLLFLAAQLVDIERLKQAAPVFFGEFVTMYIINSALAVVECFQRNAIEISWSLLGLLAGLLCASQSLNSRLTSSISAQLMMASNLCQPPLAVLASCPPNPSFVQTIKQELWQLVLRAGALVLPRMAKSSQRAARGLCLLGCWAAISIAAYVTAPDSSVQYHSSTGATLQSRIYYDNDDNTYFSSLQDAVQSQNLIFGPLINLYAALTGELPAEYLRNLICTGLISSLFMVGYVAPQVLSLIMSLRPLASRTV